MIDWVILGANLLTGALGGSAAVAGMSKYLGERWLEKLKAKHSDELEKQKAEYAKTLEELKSSLTGQQKKMQAEIDRSVFVTRAHFDAEFTALQKLFENLAEVKITLNGVRPVTNYVPVAGETMEQKLQRLDVPYQALKIAYNTLITLNEYRIPFIPEEIYQGVNKCSEAARAEIHQVTVDSQPFTVPWYTQGRLNQDHFHVEYQTVVALIRDRISKLAILPST
jgi:uncharacterized coiled-coil protein SlyX